MTTTTVRVSFTFIFLGVAIMAHAGQERAQTPRLALVGATVIDGVNPRPLPDAVVLIENGRIRAVGPRAVVTIPDGFERKDLRGLTVLPGLVDSHVHLTFALPNGPIDPQADALINAVLRDFLRCGVTSIRDLGAAYPWIIDLARSIDEGRREGPRIFAAGPIITAPGGHPAGTLLRGNDAAIEAATRQVSRQEEGRAVVRDLASGGVDIIKTVVDSGGRPNRPQRFPTLDAKVLSSIVNEAHAVGLPVTVHWGNVEELPAIVAAHPRQLEHAGYTPIPTPVVASIARAGIVVDPTLSVLAQSIGSADEFAAGPLDNVRRLHAAGVAMTAGTDAPLGNQRFGESLQRELELLVQAGLSPMEAIQAATSRPAQLLKRSEGLGMIRAGTPADVIAIAGDPVVAISNIRNVRLVIRDGRIWTERQ